jgi:hypothetical protein
MIDFKPISSLLYVPHLEDLHMPGKPTIRSTLSRSERSAWDAVLTFVRIRAAAIVARRWQDDVTDQTLSAILFTARLRAEYLLAIGETDPHVHGNRRKAALDRQIGRVSRAACRGVVRVVNGKKVMRDASVGPHFSFTVLDPPLSQAGR